MPRARHDLIALTLLIPSIAAGLALSAALSVGIAVLRRVAA